jgi:hypothetical protein
VVSAIAISEKLKKAVTLNIIFNKFLFIKLPC